MHLAQLTLFDISYIVNQLARAMPKRSNAQMEATKHIILRYLAGLISFDTTYKNGGYTLTVLSDGNRGNSPGCKKSMPSYLSIISNGQVRSVQEGLRGIIDQSTTEADLVAVALAM